MESYGVLSPEQRVLLLLGRLSFKKTDELALKELLEAENIDWYSVLNMAIKNRVLPLIWKNLYDRQYEEYVPRRLQEMAVLIYLGTKEKNKYYLEHLEEVLLAFEEKSIPASPLKGGYLIPNVYGDLGIRSISDMDCLISYVRKDEVDAIMKSLGYIQGELDRSEGIIKPISRERQIKWKTKMSNLYPYQKVSPTPYCREISFDFCFSFEQDTKPVDAMLQGLHREKGYHNLILQPSDFFTHLCCHLYKEATNAVWVVFEKDINLIKFCDVREYVLQKMSHDDLLQAATFAKIHGLEKAVFFSLFYLQQIYNDGYEQEILDLLGIKDLQFLNTYGEKDFGKSMKWKKSFWERLFASDNKTELESMPHFLNS